MQKSKRPNVLLIVSDQHRYDCLGCSGNTQLLTPHIDALAADGVLFTHAFCPFPICTPSRYSLLTSLYPYQHMASDNGATLPPAVTTFPRIFRQAGYHTRVVGKMHMTPTYQDVGFDEMLLAEQHGPGRHDDDYHRYLRAKGVFDGIDLMDQVEVFRGSASPEYWNTFGALASDLSEQDYSSTWIADRAIERIDDWKQDDNLLMVSFIKPHHPFDPPRPWDAMYDPELTELLPGWLETRPPVDVLRGRGYFPNDNLTRKTLQRITAYYYATISHMDSQIGRIVSRLRETGNYDNTTVIFCADHGEFMGFHHMILKHNYMYDPLVRIPLIAKPASHAIRPRTRHVPGSRDARLVSLVDVGPTLAAEAGIAFPPSAAGMDLLDSTPRPFICAASYDEYMIRTQRHKLLLMAKAEACQLFDLQEDPLELQNLYARDSHGSIREELTRCLTHHIMFQHPAPTYRDEAAPTGKGDNVVLPTSSVHRESEAFFRARMAERSIRLANRDASVEDRGS